MMIHCHTSFHPVKHDGTQQRERLLQALIPNNLVLDERNIAELIAFAGTLAKQVRFWNEKNEPEGDWTRFWESDPSAVLAIMAATDLEPIKTAYRSAELEYLRLKLREEKGLPIPDGKSAAKELDNLIINPEFGIYGLALLIHKLCQQAPSQHPIKQDIIRIIETKLQSPFVDLIRFHKAIEKNSFDQYQSFIGSEVCVQAWGLPEAKDFKCLDFVLPYNHQEDLWKLFLKFFNALKLIIYKAKQAFQSALRTRRDHHPHITLFISFLHLFRHLQADLNQIPQKHLEYYYQDILRLQKRKLIPDQVHVVFQIAQNLETYRIKKGTLLLGGTDGQGSPRMYQIEDDLIANQAILVEKKNYYFEQTVDNSGNGKIHSFYLPGADKKDGFKEEFDPSFKAWHPLSGKAVFEKWDTQIKQLSLLENIALQTNKEIPAAFKAKRTELEQNLDLLRAEEGFLISSPELRLSKNLIRGLLLDLSASNLGEKNLFESFALEVSTSEGIKKLSQLDIEVPPPSKYFDEAFFAPVWSASFKKLDRAFTDSKAIVVKIEQTQIYLLLFLQNFPSLIEGFGFKDPFLRIVKKDFTSRLPNLQLSGVAAASFSFNSITRVLTPLFKNALLAFTLPSPTEGLSLYRKVDGNYQKSKKLTFFPDDNTQIAYLQIPELFGKNINPTNFSVSGIGRKATAKLITNGIESGKLPEGFDENNIINGWVELTVDNPIADKEAVIIDTEDIGFTYKSEVRAIAGAQSKYPNALQFYNRLGSWVPENNTTLKSPLIIEQPSVSEPVTLRLLDSDEPDPANGNLFLGFENLKGGQSLSLLFKMAPGTGNPDHFAPNITWSYLKDDEWIAFPPLNILSDDTNGLQSTGIIKFQIPTDINNGNTRIKGEDERLDLYWLRASASENSDQLIQVDALPMLVDIHVHAVKANFIDQDNDLGHILEGLPAETITDLRFRDVNVDTILQPYSSFDGKLPESHDLLAYFRRINERLRHRHRAVTIWDYERITLEEFPKIAIVKCLSHSQRFSMLMPGHVTLVLMPFPEDMIDNGIYYPSFESGVLENIKQFLLPKANYFVTAYGDPDFCCCEKKDCGCGAKDRLTVINPRFEPIRLKVCVRFKKGYDIPYYTKQLNEALKDFLAPWANDNKQEIRFGTTIQSTQLIQFLEYLEYVDVIVGLSYKHFSSRAQSDLHEMDLSWESLNEIRPYTSASILTTYLDRLNEENPNVIDHEIIPVEEYDHCSCASCTEPQSNKKANKHPWIRIPVPENTGKVRERVAAEKYPTKVEKVFEEELKEILEGKQVGSKESPQEEKSNAKSKIAKKPIPNDVKEQKQDKKNEVLTNVVLALTNYKIMQMVSDLWKDNTTMKKFIPALLKQLDIWLDQGIIHGEKPENITQAEEEKHAYHLTKGQKVGNRIGSIFLKLTLKGEQKYYELNIDNPNLKQQK